MPWEPVRCELLSWVAHTGRNASFDYLRAEILPLTAELFIKNELRIVGSLQEMHRACISLTSEMQLGSFARYEHFSIGYLCTHHVFPASNDRLTGCMLINGVT